MIPEDIKLSIERHSVIADLKEMQEILDVKDDVIVLEKVVGISGIVFLKRSESGKVEETFVGMSEELIFSNLNDILNLGDEIAFIGVWYGKDVNDGTNYFSNKEFLVHDIIMNKKLLPWDEVKEFCKTLGMKTVPIFYKGKPDIDVFTSLVGYSELTKNKKNGAGIVIKAQGHYNMYGKPLIVQMLKENKNCS